MTIKILKGRQRNELCCTRKDGSTTTQQLGPAQPFHDLAHYVVESHFKLTNGFFGAIAAGRSIRELSDKEVIRTLGRETWLAEVMARNLQALGTQAASEAEYIEVVAWEARELGLPLPAIQAGDVRLILNRFRKICNQWEELKENEEICLEFKN